MKTLFFIRHAKSDWGKPGLADIDRHLNDRGYADSNKMSKILQERQIVPDLIISSQAIRAVSTALIFCRNLGFDPSQLLIDSNLYDASVKDYLNCISRINNKFKCVLLFGHNPTISDCAKKLAVSFADEMPTCSIVGIKSNENEWKKIATSKSELFLYDFPKNHILPADEKR